MLLVHAVAWHEDGLPKVIGLRLAEHGMQAMGMDGSDFVLKNVVG